MHDSLPLALFTVDVLLQARGKDATLTAYLLPGVLLNTAISCNKLTRLERIELLTVGYYYMQNYYNQTKDESASGVRDVGDRKVNMLFNKAMTRHLLNDFRALAYILTTYQDTCISLNRCGSNPLEHCFGVLRTQCSFVHILTRCLKALAVNQICREIPDIPINKRVGEYGCIVGLDERNPEMHLFTDPGDVVAEALFLEFNMDMQLGRTVFLDWMFFSSLAVNLSANNSSSEGWSQKRPLTMRNLTLGVCTGLKGRHLTQSKSETKKILS